MKVNPRVNAKMLMNRAKSVVCNVPMARRRYDTPNRTRLVGMNTCAGLPMRDQLIRNAFLTVVTHLHAFGG